MQDAKRCQNLGKFHDVDGDKLGWGCPGCRIVVLEAEDLPIYNAVSTESGIAGD